MLAALLMPAINSARESARQAQCMNNQRNFAQAALQYATAKEYFPGYRDLLPSQNTTESRYYIISWQVALMPNMGKTDVYQALQNDAIGNDRRPRCRIGMRRFAPAIIRAPARRALGPVMWRIRVTWIRGFHAPPRDRL